MDYVELESGLEHDLVRVLDSDRSVAWLVGQPFKLSWHVDGQEKHATHTPDVLSVDTLGQITIWDVKRPEVAVSEDFVRIRVATEAACETVGWTYDVFTGLPATHRHNLMWLHAYRRRPAWAAAYETDLVSRAADGCLLGELLRGCDPEGRAVIWHLVWAGRLRADLTARLTAVTTVTS